MHEIMNLQGHVGGLIRCGRAGTGVLEVHVWRYYHQAHGLCSKHLTSIAPFGTAFAFLMDSVMKASVPCPFIQQFLRPDDKVSFTIPTDSAHPVSCRQCYPCYSSPY